MGNFSLILHSSLLLSSLLCNSEAWLKLSKPEYKLLESVDLMLLRRILDGLKPTPKEMIYLEVGIIPVMDVIGQRRLNILHYILNQEIHSTLFKVFEKQAQTRNKNNWVSTVCTDLAEIGLNVTFEVIQQMSRGKRKNTVKIHTEINQLEN